MSDSKTMQDGMNSGSDSPTKLIGYPISIARFLGYTVFSFGLFIPVWAFKHFRYFFHGSGAGEVLKAIIYALFLPLSFHGLTDSYNKKSVQLGKALALRKYVFGISYFALTLVPKVLSRMDPNSPLSIVFELMTLIPLIAFQRRVNALNAELRPDLPFAEPMTVAKWVGLGAGVFILFLIVIVFGMVAGAGRGRP